MPSYRPWTEEKKTHSISHLNEKRVNAKSPLNLYQLRKEFKQKNETSRTLESWIKRVETLPPRATINTLFSNSTARQAKMFQSSKISSYRSNRKRDKEMLQFLAEKSKTSISPMTRSEFVEAFKKSTNNQLKDSTLERQYRYIKNQIYTCTEYDKTTKVKMLFVSKTRINENILKELRASAVVEVDDYQRIIKYESVDGELMLNENQCFPRKFDANYFKTRRSIVVLPDLERRKPNQTNSAPGSIENSKMVESESTEDIIYDGPGEPIPADLPVKQEPNVYDELFWEGEQYRPDPLPASNESEVKLEPEEYSEQITNWQEEEFKSDPLELINMKQRTRENSIDRIVSHNSQFLENNLLDRPVKEEEPQII